MRILILLFSLFYSAIIYANPFAIEIVPQKNLTNEDYFSIQKQLTTIDIRPLLQELYIPNQGYTSFEDFYNRCSRGIRQTLIDPKKGYFPIQKLEKIGKGGDMCIISCCPYNSIYPSLIKDITDSLQRSGFNGYYLYQIGGFPNPNGIEIKYVGVPYSFKIFMMIEAYNRGFNKVLWVDSAVIPLRDPTPLFHMIDLDGGLLYGFPVPDAWPYIFPNTRQLLKDLTGTDVLARTTQYLCTIVFGLKMNTIYTHKLVQDYYHLAELGTPFLSCFPEEFVLTAILGKPEFKSLQPSILTFVMCRSPTGEDTPEIMEKFRSEGYFFYQRKH